MKDYLKRNSRFKTIAMIMSTYPEVFEEQTKMQEMRDEFIAKSDRISVILNELARPISVLNGPKRDKATKITALLIKVSEIGISVATADQNVPLINSLTDYKREIMKKRLYRLSGLAENIYKEMLTIESAAITSGMKPTQLAELNTLIETYKQDMNTSSYLASSRKANRTELASLLKACTALLKTHLDSFVKNYATEYPEFYREYATIRGLDRRRRTVNKDPDENNDISGTVIDSLTEQPIEYAVVSIAEQGAITETDEDGYFLFDELPKGKFTINCHANGYDVPEKVVVDADVNDSLVIDFNLKPVSQAS